MKYRVDDYCIDTDRREIRKNGNEVPAQPQVFRLLVFLIENRHRAVPKEELHDTLWHDRVVSDSALSSRVKAARKTLGDDGVQQRCIRTIARLGFRFVGDVSVLHGSDAPKLSSVIQLPSVSEPDLLEGLPQPTVTSRGVQPGLVVLPFQTTGDVDKQYFFADGLANDITTQLAQTRSLFVIARGTAFRFRQPQQDLAAIAERLGVRYVLHGNLQFSGNRFRLHVSLTDTSRDTEVWAESFDRTLDDLFEVQDEVALAIVNSVAHEIDRAEQYRALFAHPASLDAWGTYHRGRWHMFRTRLEDYTRAKQFLTASANLDSNSSRAFAGLSFVHWQLVFHGWSEDQERDIRETFDFAHRSLALDPKDPQAHFALGRALQLRGQIGPAIEELQHAVTLNPNFALAQYAIGLLRYLEGDFESAENASVDAIRLSPYDPMLYVMLANRAVCASLNGRVDEGADWAELAASMPNSESHKIVQFVAMFCNDRAGREQAALSRYRHLMKVSPAFSMEEYNKALPIGTTALREEMSQRFSKLGSKV